MGKIAYTEIQKTIIDSSIMGSVYLEGPAGSGKTTAAVARLDRLLSKVPGHQILILIPQRSLGLPYYDFLIHQHHYRGSMPSILTLGGLARRMIGLFWPLIAQEAGFLQSHRPPHFLSLETAQFCMAKIVNPKLEKGYFHSVTIERNRLYSQIIDNLNKAAVVRFPLTEIAQRLKSTSVDDPAMGIAFGHAQECALDFRQYCLENNLLDFSLQVETFISQVWKNELCRNYFFANYQHVICDNLEEDVPVTHGLVKEWLSHLTSSLLIIDQKGGYRTFMGADPQNAAALKPLCQKSITTEEGFHQSAELQEFKDTISACILHEPSKRDLMNFDSILSHQDYRFYPEMISAVCVEITDLVCNLNIDPGQIVVLAPYLSDVLKFSLINLLEQNKIPAYSSRPSRMYFENPAIKCMLTLAKLAHPQWEMPISHFDLRDTLMLILPEIDIIRADLIVQTLFSEKNLAVGLRSFDAISNPQMQERITFAYGEKIESIRGWFLEYTNSDPQPLDIFFSRIFGELLSQKGFGLFSNFDAAKRISQVIYSIKTFRQFASSVFSLDEVSAGIEFIKTIESGLLPSVFLPREEKKPNAVLIAPAHTFLMENRSVSHQFWLDIGSMGWWERLNQPLTNPYILRRTWQPGDIWTSALERSSNQETMQRVVEGLINRCERHIYICSVQLNERGSEQRGELLQAFQTLRKRLYQSQELRDV